MAKKKINKDLLFVVTVAAMALGLMAFVAMFFPAVKMSTDGLFGAVYEYEVSGIISTFGGIIEDKNLPFLKKECIFNTLAFIGYLLPLLSIPVAYLAFKDKKNLFSFVAIALSLVGAILIFVEPALFASINEINENIVCSALVGPVLGGIFAILAGLANGAVVYLKKQ
jgi:hypothetical protein